MNIEYEFEKLFPGKKFDDILEQTNDIVTFNATRYYRSKYNMYHGTTTPIIYAYSKNHTKIHQKKKNVKDIPPYWVEFSTYMLLDYNNTEPEEPPLWIMLDFKEATIIFKTLKFTESNSCHII